MKILATSSIWESPFGSKTHKNRKIMKYRVLGISYITIALLMSALFLGFTTGSDWPGKQNRQKLAKAASGNWKNKPVKFEQMSISPFHSPNKHKELYKIHGKNKVLGYGYIGRVKTCRPGGCSRPSSFSTEGGSFEYFDYMLVFSKKLEVQKVKIINYQASRGYQISSKQWLKQFLGYEGKSSLQYGKDLQAISGATVSATSIIQDIKKTQKELEKLEKQNEI